MAVSDPASLQVLAREVAQLLTLPERGTLLTAQQVAARFNVDRSWVYAHATELGVIRLGNGPRPRLRFDAAVVEQRLLPTPPITPSASLLPIKSTRGRRTLVT